MSYKPKKSLGQNFLLSEEIANYMVFALELDSEDVVVEIGAGLGALTQKLHEQLFEYGSHIYAVEIDERFIPKLEQMFSESINITVVQADILEWFPKENFEREFKVLGSLPFNITSPILHTLVKLDIRPSKCVLLIQKEVAEKVSKRAPNASYLSTFLQTFYQIDYLKTVPRDVFRPSPNVDGGIVSMSICDVPQIFDDVQKIELYEDFLHKGFSNPRKMINKAFGKGQLAAAEVNPQKRPQEIDIPTWVKMFQMFVLNSAS